MIKIGMGPDGKPDADYTIIERESPAIYRTRPICVALMRSGVKVWLKGKRDSYVVPFEQLFIDAERGSVSIKPRRVTAAELAKFKLKADAS
jgi:hypothetical protein